MDVFEDYYEILQVHPSAEPEVIAAAYRKLAQKYHPDSSAQPAGLEKMKRINVAHDVLSDPQKRKEYHSEWLERKGGAGGLTGAYALGRPRPILEPPLIVFKGVEPGEVRKSSFVVLNTGGRYSKIWIGNPDSWLRIVDWHSLSSSDELPLRVNIEAQITDWGVAYSEKVVVKLDKEEAQLTVDLQARMKLALRDHKWHDVDYENLVGWVRRRKDRLDSGEELKGKTFVYRLNRNAGKYQIRLRHRHSSAVYDPRLSP